MNGTSCEKCVFKLMEKDTQEGCEFNVIEKLNLEKSEDEEFYRFPQGEFCQFYRPKEWIDIIDSEHKQPVDWILNKARMEVSPNVEVVIRNYTGKISDLETTVKSIHDSIIPFQHIHIIVPVNTAYHIEPLLRSKEKITKWTTYTIPKVVDMDGIMKRNILESMRFKYYLFLDAGKTVDPTYIQRLDYWLNEKLEKILMILPEGNVELQTLIEKHDGLDESLEYRHMTLIHSFLFPYCGHEYIVNNTIHLSKEHDRTCLIKPLPVVS